MCACARSVNIVCVLSPSRLCKYCVCVCACSLSLASVNIVCVCSLPLASVNTDLGGIQILILVCVCSLPLASVNTDLGGIQILILVLWCCHHGGSAGRHADLEDVQPFEFLCSFWKSSSSVFPMTIAASIIGAATTADQRNTQKIANEMRM